MLHSLSVSIYIWQISPSEHLVPSAKFGRKRDKFWDWRVVLYHFCMFYVSSFLGRPFLIQAWLRPCVQSKVHKDMIWQVWYGGTPENCTEPWPEHLLDKLEYQLWARTSVPYRTNGHRKPSERNWGCYNCKLFHLLINACGFGVGYPPSSCLCKGHVFSYFCTLSDEAHNWCLSFQIPFKCVLQTESNNKVLETYKKNWIADRKCMKIHFILPSVEISCVHSGRRFEVSEWKGTSSLLIYSQWDVIFDRFK